MVCFSTLIAVVVINLTRIKHQRALPWTIKKHLDGKLGDFLLLDHINDAEVYISFLQIFSFITSSLFNYFYVLIYCF